MIYIINHRFTSLNQYINAERSSWKIASAIKKKETRIAHLSLLGKPKIDCEFPIKLRFTWYVKDRKTDLDNIVWAKKGVLDGMIKAGIIPDDSMKYIIGFEDNIIIDKHERVEIEVV